MGCSLSFMVNKSPWDSVFRADYSPVKCRSFTSSASINIFLICSQLCGETQVWRWGDHLFFLLLIKAFRKPHLVTHLYLVSWKKSDSPDGENRPIGTNVGSPAWSPSFIEFHTMFPRRANKEKKNTWEVIRDFPSEEPLSSMCRNTLMCLQDNL